MFNMFILLLTHSLLAANGTPKEIFHCDLPSMIPDMTIEVAFMERDGKYEVIEGANFSHGQSTPIDKPDFKMVAEKCLFIFTIRNKKIYVDRNREVLYDDTKDLGKCKFTDLANKCDKPKTNPPPPPVLAPSSGKT